MTVIFVVLICLALFLFMKGVGSVFGSSIGTAAGIGCLGLIGFGVVAAIVILLLPVLMPVAIFALVCYAIIRVAGSVSRPESP